MAQVWRVYCTERKGQLMKTAEGCDDGYRYIEREGPALGGKSAKLRSATAVNEWTGPSAFEYEDFVG